MKIYDISPEISEKSDFDNIESPSLEKICSIETGNEFNMSKINMCLHFGSHIDAPLYCFDDGDEVSKLPLDKFVGPCVVAEADGLITAEWVEKNLPWDCKRLIIKTGGKGSLMDNAVFEITRFNIDLIGIDRKSIAEDGFEGSVHRELLKNDIAILEGLDLTDVAPGNYFLFAAPIKIKNAEAAPCRALLIKEVFLA